MSESEYRRLRLQLLSGEEPSRQLLDMLAATVRRLVLSHALPPGLAPYGVWDAEAAEDVFQAWASQRLIGRGDLRAMVARAGSQGVLRALAERSVRQFLLNSQARSEAQNLYSRVREQLQREDVFVCVIDSPRSQNTWWGLSEWPVREPFNGDERLLRQAAWSVPDLVVIRYGASARKLSPLLDRDELARFLEGLLKHLEALMTPAHMMSALRERLALDEQTPRPIEDVAEPVAADPEMSSAIALRESAVLALGELTSRQAKVLLASAQGRTLSDIGNQLACAPATVLNEQERIAAILRRLSGDEQEQREVLKILTDLLYVGG
jgi:DNA-binding CsgD family transcriptional regulator